jgi:hypothetical protein
MGQAKAPPYFKNARTRATTNKYPKSTGYITFSSFLLFLRIYFDIRNSNVRLFDCFAVPAVAG